MQGQTFKLYTVNMLTVNLEVLLGGIYNPPSRRRRRAEKKNYRTKRQDAFWGFLVVKRLECHAQDIFVRSDTDKLPKSLVYKAMNLEKIESRHKILI